MIKEELYIQTGKVVSNGVSTPIYDKLDLNTPSGITLEYKSNLFGDLSKIEASHSYTFQLPLTANNRRLFGGVDDIRTHDGQSRKTSYNAKYVVNGITVISNATLYVSECTQSEMSGVLTWGFIEGLKNIKDNDVSIKDLPGDMYHDSIYEEDDDLVYVRRNSFTKHNDYNSHAKAIKPIYNAGVDSYQTRLGVPVFDKNGNLKVYRANTETKLESPAYSGGGIANMALQAYGLIPPVDRSETEYSKWCRRHTNAKVMLLPPPAVPVRRLLDKIEDYYGLVFNTGTIIDNMCVPLSNVKTSEGLSRQTYTRFGLTLKNWGGYGEAFESTFSCDSLDSYSQPINESGWDGNDYINPESLFGSIAYEYEGLKYSHLLSKRVVQGDQHLRYRLEGAFMLTSKTADSLFSDSEPPRLSIQARVHIIAKGEIDGEEREDVITSDWVEVGTINSELFRPKRLVDWEGNEVPITVTEDDKYRAFARFNFSPEIGGKPIDFDVCIVQSEYRENMDGIKREIELRFERANYTDKENMGLFPYEPYLDIAGVKFLKIYEVHEAGEDRTDVNVQKNLPDIACSELIKSIYMASGTVPFAKEDGSISALSYDTLLTNVTSHAVDWSQKCIEPSDYKMSIGTSGDNEDLARRNYILMKDEEVKANGQEVSNKVGELWFQRNYAHFDIEAAPGRDTFKTLFTFPFYGDYIHGTDVYSESVHNTLHFWETKNLYEYSANEAEPILAKIGMTESLKETTSLEGTTTLSKSDNYLTIKAWQPNKNLLNDPTLCAMAGLLSGADTVTEYFRLTELDLASLNYETPIYLKKYNAYFALCKATYLVDKGLAEVVLMRLHLNIIEISLIKQVNPQGELTMSLKSDKNAENKISVNVKGLTGGYMGNEDTLTISKGNKESDDTVVYDEDTTIEVTGVVCDNDTANASDTSCINYNNNIYRINIVKKIR